MTLWVRLPHASAKIILFQELARNLAPFPWVGTKSNRKHPICERIHCASLSVSNDVRVAL
jgi:hypothetical protein